MRRKARPLGRGSRPWILGVLTALALLGSPGPWGPASVAATPAAKRVELDPAILSLVIDGPGPVVDAGVPFTLSPSVGASMPPLHYLWTCSLIGSAFTSTWTVRLPTPGVTAHFGLEVVDASEQIAWANLTLNVTADPALTVGSLNGTADTGTPLGFWVHVTGGAAPYNLSWKVTSDGAAGSAILPGAGTFEEAVWSNATGPTWVETSLVDSVGGAGSAAGWISSEFPYPSVALALSPAWAEAGQPFHLLASIRGGSPPITWSVGAVAPLLNASPTAGVLVQPGEVRWNATIELTGNFSVWFSLRDATGVALGANVTVEVIGPVNASLAVLNGSPAVGASLPLGALLGGGVGPYDYSWNLSDGERDAGNLTGPGPVNWTAHPESAGFLSISLEVRDAAGGVTREIRTVLVGPATPSPPSLPPPSPAPSELLLVVAAVALAGVGGGWGLRRSRRRTATAPDGPVRTDVVARLLKEAGELDWESMEYRAYAEDLDSPEVHRAVDTLSAGGAVRVESGPDGDRLIWLEPHETAPPTNATLPEAS